MNSESLDQIISALRVRDLTPAELLRTCQRDYKMDTLVFTEAIARLESVGLVSRKSIINKDQSGSTVYRVDRERTSHV